MNQKYEDYLKSPHWQKTKKFFKFISKKRCYVCGTKKSLVLHHKHYKTVGYEDGSELVWLCQPHHRKLHYWNGWLETPDSDRDVTVFGERLEGLKMLFSRQAKPEHKPSNVIRKNYKSLYKEVSLYRKTLKNHFNELKIGRSPT